MKEEKERQIYDIFKKKKKHTMRFSPFQNEKQG
jgi:hypothetical protein